MTHLICGLLNECIAMFLMFKNSSLELLAWLPSCLEITPKWGVFDIWILLLFFSPEKHWVRPGVWCIRHCDLLGISYSVHTIHRSCSKFTEGKCVSGFSPSPLGRCPQFVQTVTRCHLILPFPRLLTELDSFEWLFPPHPHPQGIDQPAVWRVSKISWPVGWD